jgi:predicted nucleic acid-binding protein
LNILFDTNVILDVLLERGDFLQESVALVNHVELAEINGFISASSIATIYYIAQKAFKWIKTFKTWIFGHRVYSPLHFHLFPPTYLTHCPTIY